MKPRHAHTTKEKTFNVLTHSCRGLNITQEVAMKIIAYILLMVFTLSSHAANALNDTQISRLSLLAKTWSAAKNFHTGTCDINWDQVLITTIEETVGVEDTLSFNLIINHMLDNLGENVISNQMIPVTPIEIRQDINNNWVDNIELTHKTQNRIKALINTFRPRTNCHVLDGNVGQGDFSTDNRYSHISFPNKEQRLLAVFRFWNIINHYFPYKNLIDKSWDQVLDEYIPLVYDANDSLQYQLLMRKFTAEIQDTHAYFTSPTYNSSFPRGHFPFRIKTIEGQPIIYKKTEQQSNINIGDKVIAINGIDIKTLQERNKAYAAASNPATLVANTDHLLNRGEPGAAQVTLINADQETHHIESFYGDFPSSLYQQSTVKWTDMDQTNCSIGYVNMGQLERADVDTMMRAFENKDAIIFDIRNYPNGTLWTLVNYLYSDPIQVARFAKPDFTYPGAYRWIDTTIGQGSINPYDGRLIILFNEDTISQAEYTVMGLEQHPNAVKIGSQTAAADGNITQISLPGRITINYTGLGVYYPDNRPTQRIGIIPDLFIRPTIAGIIENRDEVLESALNCEHINDLNWPQTPQPSSGLFWDPKKSGKGIDIAEFAENYTVIPYDFRTDGSPVWYLGVANFYNGTLTTGPEMLTEFSYDASTQTVVPHTQDAQLSFDFKQGPFEIDCAIAAPENKTQYSRLQWTTNDSTETRCVEEFMFSSHKDIAEEDYTGLWYGGENENGWGLSINTQGEQLVAVIYYYDQQGKATWILGNTPFSKEQPMQIEMRKFHGFCQGCASGEVPSKVVGQLTLSLSQATQQFNEGNWLSLKTDSQQWNRDKMPIKLLSALQ